ncbi:hypothetical protein LEN26_016515 [Aphanomyces euteiches]|nr:hypothetical protein LEN26_016515 [Aphanomyces euteiches]KAH9196580.1 hypothetical protein AeNC1_001440 [Aphanomyces euteiches]
MKERQPRSASWKDALKTKPILEMDFQVIWWLYSQKTNYPNLTYFIHSIVSRYRTRDVSIVLWLFFFYCAGFLGFPFVWKCLGNLIVVLTLQYAIQAKRPIDYDESLYLHECTDPDTYGFPSVDSHMAVVILLPAFFVDGISPATLAFMVACFGLVGLSRIYVGIRSPSQVVGSWATGVLGHCVGEFVHAALQSKPALAPSYHRFALVCVIVAAFFGLALWVEGNESRVASIPRQEFTRVIGSIIRGADDVGPPTSSASSSSASKRDSFYYLMQTARSFPTTI